jgi:hypothetical protein
MIKPGTFRRDDHDVVLYVQSKVGAELTGNYDSQTVNAVRIYQRENNLNSTTGDPGDVAGIVMQKTAEFILAQDGRTSQERSWFDNIFGNDEAPDSDPQEDSFWGRVTSQEASAGNGTTQSQGPSDGEIVLYPGESEYEYKRDGGIWSTRRAGTDASWISLASLRYADTVQKLNDMFIDSVQVSPDQNVTERASVQIHPSLGEVGGEVSKGDLADFENGEESYIRMCSTSHCAQYVSNMLPDSLSGNAWHRYRPSQIDISDLETLDEGDTELIESLFNEMNKAPVAGSPWEGVAKQIIKSKLGDQGKYRGIKLGSVVGLYYDPSDNFAKAFYEGITGNQDMGAGSLQRGSSIVGWDRSKIGSEYFDETTQEPWKLGQNAKVNGFGMNTHVGFVGLILPNGEPVIVHNIHRRVMGTPLSAMSHDGTAIVWADQSTGVDPMIAESKNNNSESYLLTESLTIGARNGLVGVAAVQEVVKNFLNLPDYETVDLLVATALAISSRESGMATGLSYRFSPRFGNLPQTLASRLGIADPSIGPTQIRFSNVNQSSKLANYARRFGITNPSSLSDWTKALLATVGMLSNMYEDAKRIRYNTTSSGINDAYEWTSTGNAALDLAIVGYNGGPAKVSNYCGVGVTKTRCDGSGQVVLNYIPKYGGGRSDSNTLLYVSGVANKLKEILPEVTVVMSAGRHQTGRRGPPENPGRQRGQEQSARFDGDVSVGPTAPNVQNSG